MLEEKGSTEAKKILVDAILEGTVLWTLDIALAEVANAVWKHVHLTRTLTREEGEYAVESASRTFRSMEVERTEPHAPEALRVGLDCSLSFYDSVYVSAALAKGCPMVTADGKQADRASALVEVIRVE